VKFARAAVARISEKYLTAMMRATFEEPFFDKLRARPEFIEGVNG
jgi:hypothetical protein